MPVVPVHHYRETYSAADLSDLAEAFEIPVEHRAEMALLLEDTAAIWRWYKAGRTDLTAPYVASKNLRDLSKQATKLKAALDALPPPAIEALERQLYAEQSAVVMETVDSDKMFALMVPESDGSDYPIFPDLRAFRRLVAAIADMADRASDLPNRGKGKPADRALRMWITNIDMFWTGVLGRSFTRDVGPNGEPLTQAGQFCVAAFRFVSPQTPQNSVSNAMKSHIASVKRKSLAK
jgi:hypothetical protein